MDMRQGYAKCKNYQCGMAHGLNGILWSWKNCRRLLILALRVGWPGNSHAFEVKVNVNMVGDFDEGDAFIHPVILTVKNHTSLDLACAAPLTGDDEHQFLRV